MLTKSDLEQIRKIIQNDVRTIVREEIENEAQAMKAELGSDITMSRMRIQQDVEELKDRVKNVEIKITKMHKELKEEVKMVSYFLDKENIKTLKRVKKIEEHLRLPQTN